MNSTTIIIVLIAMILAVVVVFVVAKPNANAPTSAAEKYSIDRKEVDAKTFAELKNRLMINEAAADMETTAGAFSHHGAHDAQGNKYSYLAGEENGVVEYMINREQGSESVRYLIDGKPADFSAFVDLKNSLTVEEFLNDEQTIMQGRYIYLLKDKNGNSYHFEWGRNKTDDQLFYSLEKNI